MAGWPIIAFTLTSRYVTKQRRLLCCTQRGRTRICSCPNRMSMGENGGRRESRNARGESPTRGSLKSDGDHCRPDPRDFDLNDAASPRIASLFGAAPLWLPCCYVIYRVTDIDLPLP
jgi:hypothetical protein